MPNEVRAVPEQLGDQRRLALEVPARQGWAPPKSGAVRQVEAPVFGERQLVAPGAPGADDAAMDEDDSRPGAHAADIQILGTRGWARVWHQVDDRNFRPPPDHGASVPTRPDSWPDGWAAGRPVATSAKVADSNVE